MLAGVSGRMRILGIVLIHRVLFMSGLPTFACELFALLIDSLLGGYRGIGQRLKSCGRLMPPSGGLRKDARSGQPDGGLR
jgi:hypothetical protein